MDTEAGWRNLGHSSVDCQRLDFLSQLDRPERNHDRPLGEGYRGKPDLVSGHGYLDRLVQPEKAWS